MANHQQQTDNITISELNEEETLLRMYIANFIQEAGIKLRLPETTIACAIIFMHRFFARHSYRNVDTNLVAQACLFLAGKTEETPRKARDIINTTYRMRYPNSGLLKIYNGERASDSYYDMRDALISFEHYLLRILAFDLIVDFPYKYLLNYVKSLGGKSDWAQTAWNLVNDSLVTTICLEYKPHIIACAAIYLAAKLLNIEDTLSHSNKWWEAFDTKLEQIEHICNRMLDLYTTKPPTIETLCIKYNNNLLYY